MMNPSKRKITASDDSEEENSFKHRRSSLQVNLSYSTDLTDSDNESLWKTEIVNDERKINKSQDNRRLLRRKNIQEKKNDQSEDNRMIQATDDVKKHTVNDNRKLLCTKEGILLKHLTINLEDISIKEKVLETNCKRLKDAILSKTKEMFDKQNELSIKTAIVLGSEKNQINSTHELKNDVENKSVIVPDTTINLKNKTTVMEQYDKQQTVNNQQRENIIATPTNSDKQSSKRTLDKSRLSQRRLFTELSKQKCKIIEDIVLEKKFIKLLSHRQTSPNNSPILSSNNRKLSLSRKLSKLHSQSQFENRNSMYSTVQCDQSINIGTPMFCSTFIENNEIDRKKIKTVCEMNDDKNTSRIVHTTNETISMEMTEIHGGIQLSRDTFLQNKNPNTDNYIKNNEEIQKNSGEGLKENKNIIVQKLEDDIFTMNKLIAQNNIAYDQNIESTCIDTSVHMQPSIEKIKVIRKSCDTLQAHECESDIKNQNDRQCMSSDSDNTIRSSLNVNTSLDKVTTASKAKNVQKSNKCRIIDTSQDFAIINNKESVILDNQYKTIDCVQTSLQMNTSIDSICRTWQKKNTYLDEQSLVQDRNVDDSLKNHSNAKSQSLSTLENKEENIDSLENISLIERLRNITIRNQVSETINKRINPGNIYIKHQKNNCVNNSGDSYIEATPYPISRSMLFKSQLRHKTQNMSNNTVSNSNNINSVIIEENVNKTKLNALYPKIVSNEVPTSNETSKTNEADTMVLEDTPSGNPFTQKTLTIIKNTSDEIASKIEEKIITPKNTKCILLKKNKRKLLPLHETSQCSFTPLEENKSSSESPRSEKKKKNKIFKKKCSKKKLTNFKNKTSVKHNVTNKETLSDGDYDIFKNKKKEEKKTRKPRKVTSKKIVIKKFVEENVLNLLQENEQEKEDIIVESTNSLDDFAKHRTISTQWNKHKSQKIIIVTTGLSKGDKNLVKNIVKSLGAVEMELNVSRRTTHVVSTGVRTVNLLRGIIRGCWLVTLEWVLKSLENNAWLDPEEFEMKHFSKAVQENRKDRQLFGPSYIPELFTTCGFIHVEHKTTVPCDTLKELIKTAGGHITEDVKFAKIIIGGNGLKETWVIDSITTGELQLTKFYERK